MNAATKLAQYLLEIKAVKLQPTDPFQWSSGWKSPVYCDNRVTLSFPHIRTYIQSKMAEMIKREFPEVTAICGVATAGIAMGALIADDLGLPFAYCRPKPKEHGLKNQLEGKLYKNSKVVVVEDLISTGGSSLKVVDYLRNDGYDVIGMAAIFTYGFPLADENFRENNCILHTLGSYAETIKLAREIDYVQEKDLQTLEDWRSSPSTWGK